MSKVSQTNSQVEYTLNFSTGIISQGYSEEFQDDDIRFKAFELSQEELDANKEFPRSPFLCHDTAVKIIRDKLVEIDWTKLRDKVNSSKKAYVKQYLEFGPNVLENFSEEAKSQIASDEVINKFLSKTYIDIQDSSEREAFLIEWVSGLKKLIDSHPSLRLILLQALESPGNFIIVNELESDSKDVNGLYFLDSQNVLVKKRDVEESLSTLVHESTHKVITHIYNVFSPYAVEDRTNPIILGQLIESEVSKERHVYSESYIDLWSIRESEGGKISAKDVSELSNNWLLHIVDSYTLEKYHNELLTFFIQEIARSILADDTRYSASPRFMKIIWEFLQISIILSLKEQSGDELIADEMPQFERHALAFPKSTNPIAIKAKQLISESTVCLEWLDIDDGSGKLAFQSMHLSVFKEFLNDLFQLPEDQLIVKLRGYILPLAELINDSCFFEKLFELPSATLLQIINAENVEQLISAFGSQLYNFISKLFELPSATLLQIINAENIEQLMSAFGNQLYNFISKLFELPSATLLQIINAENIEQLMSASGDQLSNFINELFELPSETLHRIVNDKCILKLLKINLHANLYKVLSCEATQEVFFEKMIAILQELDQCEQEIVFDFLFDEDILDKDKLVLFLKEKIHDLVEVSRDSSEVISRLMTSHYNLLEIVFEEHPVFLSQKIFESLSKLSGRIDSLSKRLEEGDMSCLPPPEFIITVLNSIFLLPTEMIQDIPKKQLDSFVKLVNMFTVTQVQDNASIRSILTSEKMDLLLAGAGHPEGVAQKMTELLAFNEVNESIDVVDLSGSLITVEA